MSKLWSLNGKIIVDSEGKPILCDHCPCINGCEIYPEDHEIDLDIYPTFTDWDTGKCVYEDLNNPIESITAKRTDYCAVNGDIVTFQYVDEYQNSFYISYNIITKEFVNGSRDAYNSPPVVTSLPSEPECFYGEYAVITSY